MAIDKNGFIYLEDGFYEQKRIQKFTSDGQFVSAWGNFGPGDEEIHDPDDMIIDENGFFYIAESFSGIKKFTSGGQFVTKWGSMCDRYDGSGCEDPDGDGPLDLGDGQFDRITGIALDRDGFVYTLESPQYLSPRIQKFTSDGQFIEKWEIDTNEITYFDFANDIAIDRNGFMYVSFWKYDLSGGILKFSPDGQFVEWEEYGSEDERMNFPYDIAVDMNGFVYVCQWETNRILKFSSDGQPVDTWKSWGTGDGEFFLPFDIQVDTNGFVYVHELYSSRIQKFTPEGQFIDTLPSHGQLKEIDSNNFFYYIDDHTNVDEGLIKKVSSDGEIVAQWDRTGSGYTVLLGPSDVAVDTNGFIYVADQGVQLEFWAYPTHHILKFTPDGQFVERWGKHGDGEDELSSVKAIAVDTNGFVYVCTGDTPWDGQIKKFTAEGQFVTAWNAYCWDLTVDTHGFVYCADTEPYLQYTGPNQRMLKFTSDGQFVDTWGSIGSDPGQVLGIGSIEVGPNNEIYITDVMNHRVQVFEETNPVPSILVTPRAIMQSRWMPLPLFMSIRGANTHFSDASKITFSPSSVMQFPLVVINEQTLYCIGLLMPTWLTGPLSEELEVKVTTGLENVTGSIELHMMPFM
jgi:DNA-binding beta-propeller fold protein YncE